MFRTRLLSGIILVILALALIFAGGSILAGALFLISVTAFLELTRATGVGIHEKKLNGLEITGVVLTLLYYIGLYIAVLGVEEYDISVIYYTLGAGIIVSLLVFMFVYVFTFPKFKAVNVMTAFFEMIYAPVLLSFIYMIREGFSDGIYLVWLVFLCSWGSDTCAYCVGVLIGKHKMTPKLSPKKSVEGAVGGVVGAAVLFGLYVHR